MRRTYLTKPLSITSPITTVAPTMSHEGSLIEAVGECYLQVHRELLDPRLVEVKRSVENWDLQLELTFEYTEERSNG